LCKDPRTGDVIKLRVQCNLVIGTSTARLLTAQNIAFQIASDTYDRLEAYPTEATRYGYDLGKTAAQNKAVLKEKFDKQADFMASRYSSTVQNGNGTKGLYDSFEGLPTALLSSISAANCNGNQSDPYTRIQSITSWVKGAANEHIVTSCKNFVTPVIARYYLKINGRAVNSNDVTNIMGVLVPASELVGEDVDFGFRGKFFRVIGDDNSNFNLKFVLQPAPVPVPYTFAINSVENGKPKYMNDRLPESLIPGDRGHIYRATGSELNSSLPNWIDQLVFKFREFDVPHAGHAYMRYTDKSGYSVAFGLLPALITGGRRNMSMRCLTGDCSISNHLVFIDGPSRMTMKDGWFLIDGQNLYK